MHFVLQRVNLGTKMAENWFVDQLIGSVGLGVWAISCKTSIYFIRKFGRCTFVCLGTPGWSVNELRMIVLLTQPV